MSKITRRTFLKATGVVVLGFGTQAHAIKTKDKTRLQKELELWENEQKTRARKLLEPELIYEIRKKMKKILYTDDKIEKTARKITSAFNIQKASKKYEKKLFQRIAKKQIDETKNAIAELESLIVILRVSIELGTKDNQPKKGIQKIEKLRHFLIPLRNPAYEQLYQQIEQNRK